MQRVSLFGILLCVGMSWPAEAAAIYVSSSSEDNVGQQVVYQLREAIARSSRHKLVYSIKDAAFTIEVVTIEMEKDVSTSYSAVLTMVPLDKKGFSFFIENLVGKCGSEKTQVCADKIISGFDKSMNDISEAVIGVLKENK